MKRCFVWGFGDVFFFSWVCFYLMFSRGDMAFKCVDDKTPGRSGSVSVLVVTEQASENRNEHFLWLLSIGLDCSHRNRLWSLMNLCWFLSQERSRDLKQRLGRPAFRQEARGDLEVSKLFVHPAPSLLCAPTPARGWPIGLPIEWQRHIKQTVLTDVWLHNCNRHFRHTSGSLLSIFF